MGHSGYDSSLQNLFIFSFHIPLFFIISGFLTAETDAITRSMGRIAHKKFRRLILPYIITVFIILLLQLALEFYQIFSIYYAGNQNIMLSIRYSIIHSYPFVVDGVKQYLIALSYGSGKEIYLCGVVIRPLAVLWFLPSLFSAYMIFYAFLKIFEKHSMAIQSMLIVALTTLGYVVSQYIFLPWSIDISLVSQVFMFSGYLMRKYFVYEKKMSIWFLIVAGSVWLLDIYMGGISMNERIYNHLVISTTGAIAASYLLIKFSCILAKKGSSFYKFIAYIGRQSLVVLCFSLMDVLALVPLISYLSIECLYKNNHWIILAGFRLCYSLIIAEIIKVIPVLNSVFYPRNKGNTGEGQK